MHAFAGEYTIAVCGCNSNWMARTEDSLNEAELRQRFPMFFGPQGLRAGWRVALFALVAQTLGIFLYWVALRPSFERGYFAWPPVKQLVLWLWFTIPALASAAVMARLEGRGMRDYGLVLRVGSAARLGEGFLWGLAGLVALLSAMWLGGGFHFGRVLLYGGDAWRWGAAWVVAFFFLGFLQEFVFRGYTLLTLATGMGFWRAAALLSGLFSVAHIPNGANARFFVSTVLVGLFWSFSVLRTGDLWFAVGFHSAWDWAQQFVFNPASQPGRLLESSYGGPTWLSGGATAPEGSVLAIPLLLMLWLAVAWRFPRRSGEAGEFQG